MFIIINNNLQKNVGSESFYTVKIKFFMKHHIKKFETR